jgi:hypothetical protein
MMKNNKTVIKTHKTFAKRTVSPFGEPFKTKDLS